MNKDAHQFYLCSSVTPLHKPFLTTKDTKVTKFLEIILR